MKLEDTIRSIPDFPAKGIIFRDITTLLQNGAAFKQLVDEIVKTLEGIEIDVVVGPEARGFILGAAIAYAIGAGFVPARKPGKLPCKAMRHEYQLEYGMDAIEMHEGAVLPGQRVLVVDDLLATGGTALAAIKLVEEARGEVVAVRFGIELMGLPGRAVLSDYDVKAIMEFHE